MPRKSTPRNAIDSLGPCLIGAPAALLTKLFTIKAMDISPISDSFQEVSDRLGKLTVHFASTMPSSVRKRRRGNGSLSLVAGRLVRDSETIAMAVPENFDDFEEQKAMIPWNAADDSAPLCSENIDGFRKQYFTKTDGQKGRKQGVFKVVDLDKRAGPIRSVMSFFESYVLPEGYPDSVTSSYVPYMQWRAVQYFFGGAMSVFTTRSLLHSLGVSRSSSTSGALAVNWVIKDGAGRIGKMLFARHGKKFDCDLKQFRFAADLLMELGAGVELSTMALPQFFLPLACAANVAKNIAAVTATSTRAPVYKAFAKRENIGDVTAKGESISNFADLMGTGLGIILSKKNPSLVATFSILSCGYLYSAYKEVRAIQVPTLNRARFAVAVRKFLDTGEVPSLSEVNSQESVLVMPWSVEQPLQLGVRVSDAFSSSSELKSALQLFSEEKFLVTYRPNRRRACVVLKEGATSEHVLQAAFQAHVLLYILHKAVEQRNNSIGSASPWQRGTFLSQRERLRTLSESEVAAAITQSCRHTRQLFDSFRVKAAVQGWSMGESLLNPGNARLCETHT